MAGYYDRDKTDAQPSMQWPKPHFGSVAEYQVSPWPFCKAATGAELVNFESVTRWIIITADSAAVKVSFAEPGSLTDPDTYFTVPADTMSQRLEVKCTKIWVSATCTVLAGVTSVDTSQFPDISGRVGVKH
jgi:hypothetical protein